MKQSDMIRDRLKSIMASDRVVGIEKLLTVLKSDFLCLLRNYMYIDINGIDIQMEMYENGEYALRLTAVTDHIVDPGKMLG